jgi:hypothetical protein
MLLAHKILLKAFKGFYKAFHTGINNALNLNVLTKIGLNL